MSEGAKSMLRLATINVKPISILKPVWENFDMLVAQ